MRGKVVFDRLGYFGKKVLFLLCFGFFALRLWECLIKVRGINIGILKSTRALTEHDRIELTVCPVPLDREAFLPTFDLLGSYYFKHVEEIVGQKSYDVSKDLDGEHMDAVIDHLYRKKFFGEFRYYNNYF